jgi:hypothetical protein
VATSYSHFEDRRKARFDTTSSTATTTITTIPVTTGAYYAQWDLWQNTRTGEVFRVDGVVGNNITVTRNIALVGCRHGHGDELRRRADDRRDRPAGERHQQAGPV